MRPKIAEIVFVILYVLFLCWFFNVAPADAQAWGVDTLFSPNYEGSLKAIPNEFAVSGFAELTGNFYPVAKRQLDHGRSFIRVPLLWSDTHSYGDKDIPTLKRLGAKYNPMCQQYPGKLELSPFTEHNLNNPDKYLDITQKAAPDCEIINTPWQGALSRKYKNEIHGNHPVPPSGRFNYSFDGTSAVDADVESFKKKYKGAEHFFFWDPRQNCRWSMQDARSRAERIKNCAKPTAEYHKSITYLSSNKGITNIPKGWIVKSHSEHHGPGETKGDKLMIISPVRGNEIVLKRSAKIVAKLPYFGTYQGGGFRYYHSQFGYKLGAGLDVFISGKKYGNINGGFRDGSYRD